LQVKCCGCSSIHHGRDFWLVAQKICCSELVSLPFMNILIGMFCVAFSDMCILMEHCLFPAATIIVQAPGDAPVWRQLLRLHQGHRDPGALVTNFAHGAGLDFVVLHQW
jgi:hypothetical protein